jgi:hypothetical protein
MSHFKMSLIRVLLVILVSPLALVAANVEKTIFIAPESIIIPNVSPGLEDLCLEHISLSAPRIQKSISVGTATEVQPLGEQSWYLITDLVPGTRYEVRICWPASVR